MIGKNGHDLYVVLKSASQKLRREKKQKQKPHAIYVGFNSHDAETRYICSECGKPFGSWLIFHNEPNKNRSKHYCPFCEEELEGLG